jgi:hypothetical protein
MGVYELSRVVISAQSITYDLLREAVSPQINFISRLFPSQCQEEVFFFSMTAYIMELILIIAKVPVEV